MGCVTVQSAAAATAWISNQQFGGSSMAAAVAGHLAEGADLVHITRSSCSLVVDRRLVHDGGAGGKHTALVLLVLLMPLLA